MSEFQGFTGDVTALEDRRYRNVTAPADLGYIAWSGPLDMTTGASTIATTGVTQLALVHLEAALASQGSATVGQTVTAIDVLVQTGGSTLTASQSLLGLYTAAGVLLGSANTNAATTDLATAFASTGLIKSAALTAATGQSLTGLPAGDYYVAISQVGTTPAILRGWGNVQVNGRLATTASKYATGSTNTTTLPAAMGTLAAYVGAFWVGLS
jgi:hypothetical protein